jgi:hypothetical protein
MSAPHSWLTYYFSGTSPEKVIKLLSNKIIYLEGVYAGLGGVSCTNGGIITEQTAKAGHIKNLICICKMIINAVYSIGQNTEALPLVDTHNVAYNLQEFVNVITLPAITFEVLQEHIIRGLDVLALY